MRIAVSTLIFLLLAAGTSLSQAQVTVTVGDLGIGADGPFYIGIEKGYFKEKGIEVKFARFASAAKMMAPLSAGDLQVAGGGVSPGLFNAFARKLPIKVVAARARAIPGSDSDVLMVRTDLKGKIRRMSDLRGLKVAINAKGSPLEYMLGRMLESEGLSLKDVKVVYMPWPRMAPAFANKAIDAGTLVDPFVTLFQDKGLAVDWKRSSDYIRDPYLEVAVLFYNREWAEKNPRLAEDFMTVYIRASRFYDRAWVAGKNRDELIDILVKYTRLKNKALYKRLSFSYLDPNGKVSKVGLRAMQDWYARAGMVPNKVNIDEMMDESYVKHALEQLGEYTR